LKKLPINIEDEIDGSIIAFEYDEMLGDYAEWRDRSADSKY
jgi:hypothetical protein